MECKAQECTVWSVEGRVECRAWSVKCGVWSVKRKV